MLNSQSVRDVVQEAIAGQDYERINTVTEQLLSANNPRFHLDALNLLLVTSGHYHHQEVAMKLQQIGDPSTIPYVRQVFAHGFDYLDYTWSDSGAIAKWFSHLLWKIGTPEALALIQEYTSHSDEGIRKEMLYRLKRIAYVMSISKFDQQTAHYLGTVQIHYTPTTFNAAVKHYTCYIKKRFKWFKWGIGAAGLLAILPMIPQWLNPSHDFKINGISALILVFTLAFLWSMFLLISRRINDFKSKTKQVTFTNPVRYELYSEGIVFYESHQQGILRWGDFYGIHYEEDYLWLFLHLPKSFSREATKEFSDIFIPANAIKAQPELDTFFRETRQSLDYMFGPFNSDRQ
ncbi:hypothetical protein [Escherichia sp. E4742]|uniref:hypothetical protein n=1 Tax=Escherichia sp. E4742 TaxID=2044467 RepID=UPI001F0ED6E5|nr:hypothetical protein [Escherichia sp. E4742]